MHLDRQVFDDLLVVFHRGTLRDDLNRRSAEHRLRLSKICGWTKRAGD